MVITLGNIVFGGKGNGGSSTASAYVVPDGMSFGGSTLIPVDDLDFSQKTNFRYCWYTCSSLKEFPLLDTSRGTDFWFAWNNCSNLTSFPMLDLSSGTDFGYAWASCSSLTEFPVADLSSGSSFYFTWYGCRSLTSFPQLDLSNGSSFYGAWQNCSALTTIGGFGAIKENIDLQHSTNLTVESIMNVINQAADLNELGLSSRTMTLGSTNLAKLTDEQKSVATNKGWTLA